MTLEDKLIYLTFAANYSIEKKDMDEILNMLSNLMINYLHQNNKGEGVEELMQLAYYDSITNGDWRGRINEIIKS